MSLMKLDLTAAIKETNPMKDLLAQIAKSLVETPEQVQDNEI